MSDIRDLTDAQAHGRDASFTLKTLVRELRATIDDLERQGARLERGDGIAVRAAAQIVNDFTQGFGSAGVRLHSIVVSADKADHAWRNEAGAFREQEARG